MRRPHFVCRFSFFQDELFILPLCPISMRSHIMIISFGLLWEKNENKGARILSSDGFLSQTTFPVHNLQVFGIFTNIPIFLN